MRMPSTRVRVELVVRPRNEAPDAPPAKAPLAVNEFGRAPELLADRFCTALSTVVTPRLSRSPAVRTVTGEIEVAFLRRIIEPVTVTSTGCVSFLACVSVVVVVWAPAGVARPAIIEARSA